MISRLMLNLRAPFISASRNFDSKSYTSITGSTFSINDSGNLSNGEVLLQQVDWTPNQSTVLVGHAKGRNPSDATSTTAAIQVLHGHGTAEEERLMGNINEYPRKIIHWL
ncbi:hypothetical protein AN958_07136 [Leucoagaricus sp. SymC.cos]|nr:hypothetical protein AN958_07136 [Leucoagaricus sp. SymC.cos]